MRNTNVFKGLLIIQTIAVLIYTVIAFANEGPNLLAIALFNIQSLNWNGQFNLDFSCYLALSGLWIMWRDKFSSKAIAVAIAAMILGIIFFAPYLLYRLIKENGDIKKMLVGDR
jgi:uncharacterized membrane protein YozB (DUF420 family)